ncbi:hypothetical protein SUGI_0608790 [Cryptomeria japonica]|nr:hypothetical protein SUGI_0608790 [Cryptomeria japonica]
MLLTTLKHVQGRPIEAHRAILVARSPFFKKKFQTDWRLDIAVDDMEDLVRICKVCKCEGLKTAVGNELKHQKYANYKLLRDADDSQKRFILQGSSLPEQERLPAAMHRLLHLSLEKSQREMKGSENIGQSTGLIDFSDTFDSSNISKTMKNTSANMEVSSENGDLKEFFGQDVTACGQKMEMGIQFQDKCEISNSNQAEKCCQESEMHCKLDTDEMSLIDHADVCFIVEGKKFRSHQVILASRSDYFKARLSRTTGFLEGKDVLQNGTSLMEALQILRARVKLIHPWKSVHGSQPKIFLDRTRKERVIWHRR